MSDQPATAARSAEPVKELRLALVCYGGVSLAIYMHGITKEIHRLVVASRGLERSPDRDPFGGQGSESVYWHALRDLQQMQGGLRTSVVVDVISGTSAGGINGVFLAKALAANLSQDSLRDVWMERGDLRELIRSPLPGLPLKFTHWLLGSAARRLMGRPAKPPLDGDSMLLWLHEALERMDSGRDPVPIAGASLVPEDEVLELFVTATDLGGYTRWVTAYSPKQVPDRWHRHVFRFRSGEPGTLGPDRNAVLALGARATSCFPGAFPPVGVDDVARILRPSGWPGDFAPSFAPIYRLSGADVGRARFIDGGVLDNFPFGLAIEAISKKPAWTEVDRRLLYVEPDPMIPTVAEEPAEEGGAEQSVPGIIATIWSGLSTIPRHEPILTDLQLVRERNERIAQVEDIVNSAYEQVAGEVGGLLGDGTADATWQGFTELNRTITEQAAEQAGVSHVTYVRVKLRAIVDRLAAVSARICGFPDDSNHARFLRDVVERWATMEGYLEWSPAPTEVQADFVRTFDLDYRERRIRFLIKRINQLYDEVDGRSAPPLREDLDAAKGNLWHLVLRLRRIVEALAREPTGAAGAVNEGVREIFDPELISQILSSGADTYDQAVEDFVASVRDRLNAVREGLKGYLQAELSEFGSDAYRSFIEGTERWAEDVRRDLLVRYLGFPYWDRLIYPLLRVSGITEMNRVEIIRFSPSDVRALGQRSAKEKLRGVEKGHFGAFFEREYRENDYLWGRLDGAERLLWLVFDAAGQAPRAGRHAFQAFEAIVAEERSTLTHIGDLFESLEAKLQEHRAQAGNRGAPEAVPDEPGGFPSPTARG